MLKNYKLYFQYLSYLQYPLMLIGLYFAYEPIIFDMEIFWESINKSFLFMGLAISFSTLQDSTKTQNKLSRIVYQNPKYAKIFIVYLILLTLFCLIFGVYGFLFSKIEQINQVSLGVLVLGIGMLGMLKMAFEMAAYHSKENQFQ